MKIKKTIMVFLMICLFMPLPCLFADECDDLYEKAQKEIESAEEAFGEKEYERAAEYYENAAEYCDKILARDDCRCPKMAKASQSLAERCNKNVEYCLDQGKEFRLYEEYERAVEICTEGHSYAKNKDYAAAIEKFDEAAGIWDEIGEETDSQYSKKAIAEAKNARKAADYARKFIEE